ncbi:hypothetical protein ABZW32_19100 [Streptomyces sp. NPDC004667]|uniref:hypothetical protein n=1 Tax=Streptomyces sp. NPDC004667 TaxID=3154285 RepID=UPI0033BE2E99
MRNSALEIGAFGDGLRITTYAQNATAAAYGESLKDVRDNWPGIFALSAQQPIAFDAAWAQQGWAANLRKTYGTIDLEAFACDWSPFTAEDVRRCIDNGGLVAIGNHNHWCVVYHHDGAEFFMWNPSNGMGTAHTFEELAAEAATCIYITGMLT